MTSSPMRAGQLWFIALLAFALSIALGIDVMRSGEPAPLMAFALAIVGHFGHLAWRVTEICRPEVLAPVGFALIVLAIFLGSWRARIGCSLLSLLAAWRLDALLQHIFMRPRRLDWVIHHETSYSYPSSHASIVVGFYLLWAYFIARSTLPRSVRIAVPSLLALLWPAILWSRLALGAHYPTDLLGGTLVGIASTCALAALVATIKVLAAVSKQA